jgi:hypothetical protein
MVVGAAPAASTTVLHPATRTAPAIAGRVPVETHTAVAGAAAPLTRMAKGGIHIRDLPA